MNACEANETGSVNNVMGSPSHFNLDTDLLNNMRDIESILDADKSAMAKKDIDKDIPNNF